MKIKIGQDVYVNKVIATDSIDEIPGGLGKISDIEFRRSFQRKVTQLITVEEVPGIQYTWTNHLEKCQAALKKMYGKQRAGVKNGSVE